MPNVILRARRQKPIYVSALALFSKVFLLYARVNLFGNLARENFVYKPLLSELFDAVGIVADVCAAPGGFGGKIDEYFALSIFYYAQHIPLFLKLAAGYAHP